MKWMLVVLVFELAPVETDFIYDTLDECLSAAEEVQVAYTEAYNKRATGPRSEVAREYWESRLLKNAMTCVPSKLDRR